MFALSSCESEVVYVKRLVNRVNRLGIRHGVVLPDLKVLPDL